VGKPCYPPELRVGRGGVVGGRGVPRDRAPQWLLEASTVLVHANDTITTGLADEFGVRPRRPTTWTSPSALPRMGSSGTMCR
jgi:hypothetical protein